MMDCKSMDTPMNADIRKVKVPDSDPVDPSLYSIANWIIDVFGKYSTRYLLCC
jgi:hypothetical protein